MAAGPLRVADLNGMAGAGERNNGGNGRDRVAVLADAPIDAERLLHQLLTGATHVVNADSGYIMLVEPDGSSMECRIGTGNCGGLVGCHIAMGEGLSGRVWEQRTPVVVDDYANWGGRSNLGSTEDALAGIGVPLIAGGEVIGVLGLARTGKPFTQPEQELACRFAELASIALDNARLAEASQRQLGERVRAERQLREAQARYRALVEQMPAVTYSERFRGEDGQRVYVSPQISDMLGYTQAEAEYIGFWRSILHEDDRERVLEVHDRCRAAGEPYRLEYRVRARDGRVVWVRDECGLVCDQNGRPLLWQGLLVDVTESKRVEQATMQALEREREAAQRLRALDDMKSTFLHAVSHELRTPLAAVLGIGLTLQRAGDSLPDDDVGDLVSRLVGNARKLDRLLTDLLDLDRLSRGIVEPKREPTDVATLVHRVVEEWRLRNDRDAHVVAEPVVVSLDPGQVERIVENLLANAARHTTNGTPVWVRVAPDTGGVLLTVEDAGSGVPQELRASVFEPFRQGPGTPTHAPGVGIGLSLVARFAELHGGRAWLDDRPGGGSSFRVHIPGA